MARTPRSSRGRMSGLLLIFLCGLFVALLLGGFTVTAFSPLEHRHHHHHHYSYGSRTWSIAPSIATSSSSSSSLYSSSPPRQPRRMLKKRRRSPKNNKNSSSHLTPAQSFDWESTESRPLVPSKRKEAGEDYWIDENDLLKFEAEQQAIKDRKESLMLSSGRRRRDGVVSKEKLMTEVKAPYKQNWIGYFSVVIAILSTIIIKFPELLDQPTIRIPDL